MIEQSDTIHKIAKEKMESIVRLIPEFIPFHGKDNDLYRRFSEITESYFTDFQGEVIDIAPVSGLVWPHTSLGNLTSYNFFCSLDEWLLYSFYWVNRNRYHTVMDIGANIGVDSIILNKMGYKVYSFEPDPQLYNRFMDLSQLNNCRGIQSYNKAMSDSSGVVEFVRVHGNTTANHIKGVRDFYGDADFLEVETVSFQDLGVKPDMIKINTEGHEATIIASISLEDWRTIDAFVEIHNDRNGKDVFKYFEGSGINIFSQSLGWQKINSLEEMPVTNKVGYVFVSSKLEMPWHSEN